MSTKINLAVWGAGGHALVVADILRLMGGWSIIGFLDDLAPERRGSTHGGGPVLGGSDQLPLLWRDGVRHLALGVGNCAARLRFARSATGAGFALVSAVHPRSIIAGDVTVGEGTVVAAGAVINPGARLGAAVIINTGATVDHECVIEDGAHLCPGVHLAGNVRVGEGAWVGIGTTVIEKVRIGAGAFIGAGSLVLHDVPEGTRAFGAPARVVGT